MEIHEVMFEYVPLYRYQYEVSQLWDVLSGLLIATRFEHSAELLYLLSLCLSFCRYLRVWDFLYNCCSSSHILAQPGIAEVPPVYVAIISTLFSPSFFFPPPNHTELCQLFHGRSAYERPRACWLLSSTFNLSLGQEQIYSSEREGGRQPSVSTCILLCPPSDFTQYKTFCFDNLLLPTLSNSMPS